MACATQEPTSIQAGDTIEWTKSLPDYPASDGWSLKYVIAGAGKTGAEVDAIASGDDFAVTIAATNTAALVAGDYTLAGRVSKDGGAKTIYSSPVTVLPDLASPDAIGVDNREFVEQALEAVEKAILGAASSAQSSLSINGKSISQRSHEELIMLRRTLRRELKSLRDSQGISSGLGNRRRILTRFPG